MTFGRGAQEKCPTALLPKMQLLRRENLLWRMCPHGIHEARRERILVKVQLTNYSEPQVPSNPTAETTPQHN